MPVKTGIQVRLQILFQKSPGFRLPPGMTGKVKLVNKFTTPALRAKVRSVNHGETE
jgi:hypothetical protein